MGKDFGSLDHLLNEAERALKASPLPSDSKRDKVDLPMQYWIASGAFVSRQDRLKSRSAKVTELGKESILFLTKEIINKGSEISIFIGEEKSPSVIRGSANISSVTKVSGGIYKVEAIFTDYNEEYRKKESRTHSRFRADMPVEIKVSGSKSSSLGRVVDVSKSGMKIIVKGDYSKDEFLEIKMYAPGGSGKIIHRRAKIIRFSEEAGKREIGIKFIGTTDID